MIYSDWTETLLARYGSYITKQRLFQGPVKIKIKSIAISLN